MKLLSMDDVELAGKRVLIREDLNVPIKDGETVIGAVGVSGGNGKQDQGVAEAAAQAFARQRLVVDDHHPHSGAPSSRSEARTSSPSWESARA